LLLIAATLTRPEGGIFTAVLGCFFLTDVLQKRRSPWHFTGWCASWFSIIGAHFIWRHWAYGLWLPNTFYAKVNGAWLEQSQNYFSIFNKDYNVTWYGWLIFIPLFFGRRYLDRLFFAVILSHVAYLTYIGGDRFEFRFLAFILPPAYWLVARGCLQLADAIPAIRRSEFIALLVVSAISATTLEGSLRTETRDRHHIASIHHMRAYANRRAKDGAFIRSLVTNGSLSKDLRICVGGAGALPYTSQLHTLDYFGLNDAKIAQKEVKKRRRIGHEHRASAIYMREQGIVMYDILGNLVYEESDNPSRLLSLAKSRAKSLNGEILKARCRKADDKYLIYATAVSSEIHDKELAKLDKCKLGKSR
jgi:arabinofuranosyltransferase